MPIDNENVYGSGLRSDDWIALRDIFWPFIHAKEPEMIELPSNIPEHLQDHPLLQYLKQYQATVNKEYLDKAGQILIPTKEPFGWYLPLTK